MRSITITVSTVLLLTLTCQVRAESWPAWRGDAAGSGVTSETKLPLKWDKDTNVRWRIELPDRGNSTPIVWKDRVFVTQAIDETKWRGLLCFNRADGKLLWKNGVTYSKKEQTHKANPYCSSSAVTDGEYVIVYYGSAGAACYDFSGKEIWRRDFGAIHHVWGTSTSPVLYGDTAIFYHGPGKGAFLVALDKKTGKTVWKFDEPQWKVGKRTDGFRGREDKGIDGSFSTPIKRSSWPRQSCFFKRWKSGLRCRASWPWLPLPPCSPCSVLATSARYVTAW